MPTRRGMAGIGDSGVTLNKDILAAAYSYLKITAPFHRWSLPDASEIKFRVTRARNEAGSCEELVSGKVSIAVSDVLNGHTNSIITTMAHEMIHVRQLLRNMPMTHGYEFQRMASQICKKHGFDLLGF